MYFTAKSTNMATVMSVWKLAWPAAILNNTVSFALIASFGKTAEKSLRKGERAANRFMPSKKNILKFYLFCEFGSERCR